MDSILNALIIAKAPERFTNKFFEDLGFKSSTDRLFIAILEALLDKSSWLIAKNQQTRYNEEN